ncbi:MAG TPA: hypothetical protein VGG29_12835 [Caulobacteraceae bacterium]
MNVRAEVDLAIDEDRRSPCLWVPSEHWAPFCAQLGRGPNAIGAIVYRGKSIREGPPWSEVTTRRPG